RARPEARVAIRARTRRATETGRVCLTPPGRAHFVVRALIVATAAVGRVGVRVDASLAGEPGAGRGATECLSAAARRLGDARSRVAHLARAAPRGNAAAGRARAARVVIAAEIDAHRADAGERARGGARP